MWSCYIFCFHFFVGGFLNRINCTLFPRDSRGGVRRSRRVPLHAIVTDGAAVLREWSAREKILRRHRRNSGRAVSVEVSRSRTGYAIFIIRRIGEPEDYVVQIRTDPGDIVKGESLIDDGIDADMPSARRIGGEVPDILNRAEGRHRHFGQEDRKGRIGPQALGMQIQGIHTANVLPRKNGNGRRRVRQAGCDGI